MCKINEIKESAMESILSISKALGEKNRLRVFLALIHTKELCVCEVGELLGLAPATVSRHMSILSRAKLVDSRKRGKWVYYCIKPAIAPELLQWIKNSVVDSFSVAEDVKRIEILVRERQDKDCTKACVSEER